MQSNYLQAMPTCVAGTSTSSVSEFGPTVFTSMPCPTPLQGHAAHMRTHIDMRVGDYKKAIDGNRQAIHDDADWTLARRCEGWKDGWEQARRPGGGLS